MKWHATDVEQGLSMAYLLIPPKVRADHHTLQLLCARNGTDNRGILRGARLWTPHQWRLFLAGKLERAEVDAIIGAALAVWVPSSISDQIETIEDPDCGWITVANLRDLGWSPESPIDRSDLTDRSIGAQSDRSPIEQPIEQAIGDRVSPRWNDQLTRSEIDHFCDQSIDHSAGDLVVVHYDLGGQIRSAKSSEDQRNRANSGWKTKKQTQLGLSFPTPPGVSLATDRTTDRTPIDRSLDRSVPPIDARALPGALPGAMHDHENEDQRSPPTPPLGGRTDRSRSDRTSPDPLTLAAFVQWWAWFLEARPRELDPDLWGGGRLQVLDAIVTQAQDQHVEFGQLLLRLQAVLRRLFADKTWVRSMANRKRHFKSWIRQGDYLSAEQQAQAKVLQLVRPPTADDARAALERDQQAREREAQATWAEDFPGEAWPGFDEAVKRINAKHWRTEP